jgi:meso-butanediol dehydrogenase/(S,S)-butanediol dehydrogenase/diacetyl reductase
LAAAGRLDGKVVMISGTGSGQGRAAAIRFAREGALVVGCDVNAVGNEETVALIQEIGFDMLGLAPLDPSLPVGAELWVEQTIARHGRVDVLYNNAGASRPGALESLSEDDWRFTMKNEIDVVFFPTQAAWSALKQTRGVVVSTGSVAGHLGIPTQPAHCAGKAAVIALARSFAAAGAPHGIRSVSISPGPILVEGGREFFADPKNREAAMASTLLNRLGDPDEVAALACFLASDEASYMTGVDVAVDGGEIIKWH